jgi:hypothetical protein
MRLIRRTGVVAPPYGGVDWLWGGQSTLARCGGASATDACARTKIVRRPPLGARRVPDAPPFVITADRPLVSPPDADTPVVITGHDAVIPL